MKHPFLLSLLVLLAFESFSQNRKMIQKPWIKTSVEELSGRDVAPDTLYTRYDFDKATLYISFYPAWDDYQQPWSINGKNLTIGFDTYQIEELTDTSLTFSLAGFRRMRFLSEEYLSNQDKNLRAIGEYQGKPLYEANHFITPRYTTRTSLSNMIQLQVEGYNVKKATHFYLTFVVNEAGGIENIQIVKGISLGFDKEVSNQLLKSSKHWRPAYHQGKPIQTQMFYEIKYLDSLVPGFSR